MQIHAQVIENGQIKLDEPLSFPIGYKVLVTIEPLSEPIDAGEDIPTPEELAAEDALWDEFFDSHPELLTTLADQARRAIKDGTAVDWDPDTDEI